MAINNYVFTRLKLFFLGQIFGNDKKQHWAFPPNITPKAVTNKRRSFSHSIVPDLPRDYALAFIDGKYIMAFNPNNMVFSEKI